MHNKKNSAQLKGANGFAPEVLQAFRAFDIGTAADAVIPAKFRELIAFAAALITQCPYCIQVHSRNARKEGATDCELVEAAMIAAALRTGGSARHEAHGLPN